MHTFLLLPGLVCDAAVWRHQQPALAKLGTVIIPDLNHADTPAKMVAAALKNAPETFALAGHSMGGWVALEIMRQSPERVHKLCLLNTTSKADSAEKAAARREMIHQIKHGESEAVIHRLLSAFCYQQRCLHEVEDMIRRNLPALISQENTMLARQEADSVLPAIHCPTLIIHANQDKIFNDADAKNLHANINNSTLECIDQCGHMSPLEAPQQVTQLMLNWVASPESIA